MSSRPPGRASASSGSSVLQLHLPERWPDTSSTSEPLFRWARYDGARVERGVSSLREIRTAAQIIVVAPASRVLCVRTRLPGGRASRQDKVLAFAVEDSIGAAPEEVHAIFAGDLGGGESLIAVVGRAWLRNVVGELDMQGFTPTRFLCEGELLAARSGGDARTWTVVRLGSGGFAHLGGFETLPLDIPNDASDEPPLALKLVFEERSAEAEAPDGIEVLAAEGARPPDAASWAESLSVPVSFTGLWTPESIDARRLTKTNLLGGIAGRKASGPSPFSRWKPAAVLAATILVAHGALMTFDWWRMEREASDLRAGMEARFRRIFPEAKTVVDPPRQLAQLIGQLRRDSGEPAADDFLALLGRLTPGLAAANATARNVGYEKGTMRLEISIPSAETQESLGTKLGSTGLRVQVERVTTEGATAIATLRVSPG